MARHSKSKHSEDNFEGKSKPLHGSHRRTAPSDTPKSSRRGAHAGGKKQAQKSYPRGIPQESSQGAHQGAPQGFPSPSPSYGSSADLSSLVTDPTPTGIQGDVSPFETTMGDLLEIADDTPLTRRELREQRRRQKLGRADRLASLRSLSEVVMAVGLVIALYVVWMLGWTGILASRSQQEQLGNSGWAMPANSGNARIAPAQAGDPPVQPTYASEGDLIGQIYLPSVWGVNWQRNIVQGTTLSELNRHGYGHYDDTQMPGELGNFAIAGHNAGYGEPGGRNTDLKKGDALIVRTKDYWYIYKMTDSAKVLPNAIEVIAPVPNKVGEQPTKRYITLTTCWPKYHKATHRYIVWGEFDYWAKVSDGIPKELYNGRNTGAVHFSSGPSQVASKLPALDEVFVVSLLAFAVIYIAAAIVWKYPARKERGTGSICGFIWRHLPGIKPIRVFLMILLAVAVVSALFQWAYPWASANIPMLQDMSNFTISE